MQFKYIIFSDGTPVIFPIWFEHVNFKPMDRVINSAGFVSIHILDGEVEVSAYGESVSLKLESNASDAEIIKKAFFKERN